MVANDTAHGAALGAVGLNNVNFLNDSAGSGAGAMGSLPGQAGGETPSEADRRGDINSDRLKALLAPSRPEKSED